ncbi:MAG TPA: PAS domain-containing sensor histidine kinase [Rhodospirillales bacterium]|nr:PAS domain-containing sensor histidine kinase [Rhodospirillales bacterium]
MAVPGASSVSRFFGGRPPWLRPKIWAGASLALIVMTVAAWLWPGGPGTLAVNLAILLFAALLGLAWSLGRAHANPAAKLLLAAAEDSHDARLITTAAGAFVYANAAFYRLFALAVSLDSIADILEGGDARSAFARLRASAEAGAAECAEVPLHIPAGPVEWLRISVSPLPQDHVLWRAEDITAQRELDVIRDSEEKMRADFLYHLPAGFFSVDGGGRILYANQILAEWLGAASGDALRGRMFSDFVIAEESVSQGVGEDDSNLHGEVTLMGEGEKTVRACLVQSQRLSVKGELVHSRSVVLRDMTWSGDGAKSSSEQTLHWLFGEAPVGIVLLDPRGDVTDCNRAFLKLLGVHREAVVGRPFVERVSKEDSGEVGVQLSKVLMGAVRAAHLEVRMPGSGQRELVTSLFASHMKDANGEMSGLVLHFIDTTEHKNLEVQFAQSQKMQAVGQLAGGGAHDFNNLLTAMIGFCDLLFERHGPEDPSFADIMQIKQNANRATNLVRQLLAFSRQQSRKPEMVDATDVLSDLSNLLGRLIGENIELRMEHDRDLGLIQVDRGQFDQVFINLAVNSRDAMPGGGILTIRTSNVAVEEDIQRGHEVMPTGFYVLIEVMDTGSGIAKEDIGRIFEPFFSTKEVGEGTGLGLSTVYGIVHQSDGYIVVDSAPGEGTTFGVYLPSFDLDGERSLGAEQAKEDAGEEAGPPRPPLKAREEPVENVDLTGEGCVLLVEDEDAVRMFAARALRNKGYNVLEAKNGEAALDAIGSSDEKIDLIISDVVMPGMDGHTLVQLIRQEVSDVKVILMSGYAEEVLNDEIARDATIHFLPKPFSLKDMAGKVKEVLAEAR